MVLPVFLVSGGRELRDANRAGNHGKYCDHGDCQFYIIFFGQRRGLQMFPDVALIGKEYAKKETLGQVGSRPGWLLTFTFTELERRDLTRRNHQKQFCNRRRYSSRRVPSKCPRDVPGKAGCRRHPYGADRVWIQRYVGELNTKERLRVYLGFSSFQHFERLGVEIGHLPGRSLHRYRVETCGLSVPVLLLA